MHSCSKFRIFIYLGFTLLFVSTGFAKNCNLIQNTRELYECTLENHPDFKSAILTKESASASKDKATQWPNPELSVKSVTGENAGEKVGETEVNLTISISDLLIKRPALSKTGRAEEKVINVQAQEQEFKAKASVVKHLYRYRQLLNEVGLVDEAIATFGKLEQQFKSRRARGPEQNITLTLLELAQGDYQLRKNHLAVEKAEIEVKFKGIFGPKFELKNEILPQLKQIWPDINFALVSKDTLELRRLEAEKERFEAEKSLANAESWPKISAGPTAERSTEGSNQFNSYGFNLTVDIPIFSLNGGARDFAEKNMMKAQLQYEYALKKVDLERELLIQKYKSAVESLKRSTDAKSLKKKHAQIDSYFRQGLTSGSTVIEAHRQIAAFTESQHEHEMVALESLMYLNLLSDKDPSEVIK